VADGFAGSRVRAVAAGRKPETSSEELAWVRTTWPLDASRWQILGGEAAVPGVGARVGYWTSGLGWNWSGGAAVCSSECSV